MSRGNERRPIVRDDADRQRRFDSLQRTVETCDWRLHAFVLLTNHEHLFLETPEANLSAGMHLLNGSYTGYFNLRQRSSGKSLRNGTGRWHRYSPPMGAVRFGPNLWIRRRVRQHEPQCRGAKPRTDEEIFGIPAVAHHLVVNDLASLGIEPHSCEVL